MLCYPESARNRIRGGAVVKKKKKFLVEQRAASNLCEIEGKSICLSVTRVAVGQEKEPTKN